MTKHTELKHTVMSADLFEYLTKQQSGSAENIFDKIRRATTQFGEDAMMQVPDHQGTFMTILTRLIGAKSAMEIGTFTGASSICIARGLADGGRLICLDKSKEWTDVAQRFWKQDGVDDRIELRLGDAMESLAELPTDSVFDLVHIDTEKSLYDACFEATLPYVRQGGVFVFDNMLWGGRVVSDSPDDRTKAIMKLNEKLTNDSRVENVLVEIGDGLQICRKV